MKLNITPEASSLFPQLGAAGLPIWDLQAASGLRRERDNALVSAEASMAGISDYDGVTATAEVQMWRETMRVMGLRPGEFRSSLEALMRMWVGGRRPNSGTAAIDLYNSISIFARSPLGAVDQARIPSDCDLALRIPRLGEDRFEPVAGTVTMKPGAAAISYCFGNQIVCYALNHRDSALFGLRDTTDEAIFFTEWTNAAQRSLALAALDRLASAFRNAGAETGNPLAAGWNGT